MDYSEALKYIQNLGWSQKTAGLQRIREVLALCGNPQDRLSILHVAGSNGKGSVCAILSSVLSQAGYHVGLFTSPDLLDYRERIQLDGEMISKEDFVRLCKMFIRLNHSMKEPLTTQEITTAMAFQYFSEKKPDFLILEVGMGGELDSTNVISRPIISVITNLSLEHTQFLGNSLEEIARAKAGIIKKNRPVVSYHVPKPALEVLQEKAKELGAPLYRVDPSKISFISHSLEGQSFSVQREGGEETFDLSLLGRHQVYNAATALLTLEILEKEGLFLPISSIREGLKKVSWPGRLELLEKTQPILLDGGHNPQGAMAMRDFLEDYFPGQKVNFLFAILRDKNVEETVSILKPYAESFSCLTAKSSRAMEKEKLCSLILSKGAKAQFFSTIPQALDQLRKKPKPIIIFGSLALAGEVLSLKNTLFPGKNDFHKV